MTRRSIACLGPCSLMLILSLAAYELHAVEVKHRLVGAAAVDITPDYPILLSGYASRGAVEVDQVEQRIWAKALALGSDAEGPAILLTVDNCGVPAAISEKVAATLREKANIPRERIAICSSHSHTAPMLAGVLGNLLLQDPTDPQMARIERYTRELTEKLIHVALAALEARAPAELSYGMAQASFAANRRTAGGPVDHDLPVLIAKSPEGKIRAVLCSYACHCTTLQAANYIGGDWVGYAQEGLEREFPGAVALVAVGCGGDQNPTPRGTLELARQYGQQIVSGVKQTVQSANTPIRGQLAARFANVPLRLAEAPTKEQFQRRAEQANGITRYHAQKNLDRLARGEKLPTEVAFPVQTWAFGDELAIVFLGGEVVVDYSLRLKREFDRNRMWVVAYSNDQQYYIPSERVLREGGYEGGGAMLWYDWPAPFAPGLEQVIFDEVHRQLPPSFRK